jgi:hypothetical protein
MLWRLLVGYRRFQTTCLSHLHAFKIVFYNASTLKMGCVDYVSLRTYYLYCVCVCVCVCVLVLVSLNVAVMHNLKISSRRNVL